MKCKNCQTENDQGAKYCRHCGAPLENSIPASGKPPIFNKQEPSKNQQGGLFKKHGAAFIAGALVLVAAIGAGWYFFSSNSETSGPTMYTEKELIEKANALYGMGDIEGAANICEQMLAQDPGNERVLGLLTNLQAIQESVENGETTVDAAEDPFVSYTPSEDTRKFAIGHYELPADQPVVDSYYPQYAQDDLGEQRMFVLDDPVPAASNSQPSAQTSEEQKTNDAAQAVPEKEAEKEVTTESLEKDLQKLASELPTGKKSSSSTEEDLTKSEDKDGSTAKETDDSETKKGTNRRTVSSDDIDSDDEEPDSSKDKEKEPDSTSKDKSEDDTNNDDKNVDNEDKDDKGDKDDKDDNDTPPKEKEEEPDPKEEVKPVPNVLERSVLVLGPGQSYTFSNPALSSLSLAAPANQSLSKSADPKKLLSIKEGTITNIAGAKEDGAIVAAKEEGNNDECLVLVTDQKKAQQANANKLVMICNENRIAGIKNVPAQEITIKVKSQPVVFRADDLTSDTADQNFTWSIVKEGEKNQSKIAPSKNYCTFYPGGVPCKTTLVAANAKGEKVEVIINIVA